MYAIARPSPFSFTVRALIAVLLTALALQISVQPAQAAVDARAESEFVRLINAARVEAGRSPLVVRQDLVNVARRHSARMARDNRAYHNPNVRNEIGQWFMYGENVGRGKSVPWLHDAFMASRTHRDNILHQVFTEVGVGVEVRGRTIFVTEVFRRPRS